MKSAVFEVIESLGITVTPLVANLTVIAFIALTAIVVHLLIHRVLLAYLAAQTEKSFQWLHTACFKHSLINRIALLLQGIILYVQARLWLATDSPLLSFIEVVTHLWIMLFALLSVYSLLDTIAEALSRSESGHHLPLKGIVQSLKIAGFFIASIFAISLLIGKSPLILFSGLGAMSAVLMLMFKDSIMGLVAGIQLSSNNMLAVGDWLEMPKYGADGDVIDISLTTVKVRNWDKTITTVPTYALISDSFKNWRGMSESGGRRIKRSVFIDATSVAFLTEQNLADLRHAALLSDYIEQRVSEINADNSRRGIDTSFQVNGRRLTNLGTFRAYLTAYLADNNKIHKNMTQMVRQLKSGENGIPLEVYCFTATTAWLAYEDTQADVFDHIFAVLPEFGLRVFQNPTGYDMRSLKDNLTARA